MNKKPRFELRPFVIRRDGTAMVQWIIDQQLHVTNAYGHAESLINKYCASNFLVITHTQRQSIATLLKGYVVSALPLVKADSPTRPDSRPAEEIIDLASDNGEPEQPWPTGEPDEYDDASLAAAFDEAFARYASTPILSQPPPSPGQSSTPPHVGTGDALERPFRCLPTERSRSPSPTFITL